MAIAMVMFMLVDYPLILTLNIEVFRLKVKYCTESLHFFNEPLYLAFAFVFILLLMFCFFFCWHMYSLIWNLGFEDLFVYCYSHCGSL